MNRRTFLASAVALALPSCSSTSLTPAQLIADSQGALSALNTMLPQLVAAFPKLMPAATVTQIQTGLAAGISVANTLSSTQTTQQGATVLQQVESYLNQALDALAAIPLIPAPYSTIIAAAAVIAPEIEAFVNANIASSTASLSPRAKGLAPSDMTVETARVLLGIKP